MTGRGNFLHNLVLFGRVLRRAGIEVTPRQVIELAQALPLIDLGRKADVHAAARALLIHRRTDWPTFDRVFALFWKRRSFGSGAAIIQEALSTFGMLDLPKKTMCIGSAAALEGAELLVDDERAEQIEIRQVFTYSPTEALRHKDFGEFNRAELDRAKQLLRNMSWSTGLRRTRRRVRGGREFFDSRTLLRRQARAGGDWIELAWKQTRVKPRQLVALCDISGSMENYTRVLLHFLHTLGWGQSNVEVFTFSTRLTRITRALRVRNVDAALREVTHTVEDWSGGTRIGAALHTFNYKWSRRVLRPGAVVLIISDGWDRGEPALLERELRRLKRSAYRLVWLNPLIASSGFEPLTQGLKIALPLIDDFMPIHNLASLDDLAQHLSRLK